MIQAFLTDCPWLDGASSLGADLALKTTFFLLLACGLDRVLGRRQALLRSAMWNVCVAALLVLPLVTVSLPRIPIRCLPPAADTLRLAMHASAEPRAGAHLSEGTVVAAVEAAAAPDRAGIRWTFLVGTVYFGGAGIWMLRLAVSFVAVLRLRRAAVVVTDSAWLKTLQRWQQHLGVDRPVMLGTSYAVGVPAAAGWLRPAILLPVSSLASGEASHRDVVVLHELAHIRRRDCLWQLLLRVAQAVYWPHPLVWVMGRAAAAAREQACDDVCVHWTSAPETYREALVRVAASLAGRRRAVLGTALARSTRIRRRLDRIDAGFRSERALAPWPARASFAVLALVAIAAFGPAVLVRRDARAVETAVPSTQKSAAGAPALGSTARATATKPGAADARPSVKVDELEYNFGSVLGVSSIEHTYKLRNVGAGPLQIEKVNMTCGCTIAGAWARTVLPGETWELPITLKISSDGHLSKDIVVTTSDPAHREIRYVIAGEARLRFGFNPYRVIQMTQLRKDSVEKRTVTITNRLETPIKLKNATVNSPSLRVALRERTKGKEYEVEVTTVPPLSEGTISGRVRIETDCKDEPAIELPVYAHVPPRLYLAPTLLSLPHLVEQDTRRGLALRNMGTTDVHVKRVEVSTRSIRTEVQTITAGKVYQIWLVVPAGTEIPEAGWTVTVSTDDPQLPALTAKVRPYTPPVSQPATLSQPSAK